MSRNPTPTDSLDTDPTSIMIGCPAESLVRVQVPAPITPDPGAILVRLPIIWYVRSKSVTVIACIYPAAVRRQPRIKEVIIVFIGLRDALTLIFFSSLRRRSIYLTFDGPSRRSRYRNECCRQIVRSSAVPDNPPFVVDSVGDVQGNEPGLVQIFGDRVQLHQLAFTIKECSFLIGAPAVANDVIRIIDSSRKTRFLVARQSP